jgi:predicted phosphate transport protein (TIGR00153 family)
LISENKFAPAFLNIFVITKHNQGQMSLFTRPSKELTVRIDEFFDTIEIGILIFKEGVRAYANGDHKIFQDHLNKIDELEGKADKLQRSIENDMIIHSILPQQRSEFVKLLWQLDEIIDTAKASLNEFYIEMPRIPPALVHDFISLAEVSGNAAEELMPAARAFFREPHLVREKLIKVYFFERECDKAAFELKKRVFHEMNDLSLAEKAHIRYITHHIENISDTAQDAADLLASMAIRQML